MAELLQIELHGFPLIAFLAMFAAFWALGHYLTRGVPQRVSAPAVRTRALGLQGPPAAFARPAPPERKLAA